MKSAISYSVNSAPTQSSGVLQLGCMAASPIAVRAAIDSGADWVRIPYRLTCASDGSIKNPRLAEAIRYARGKARKLVLDLGVLSLPVSWEDRRNAFSWADDMGFDALALSDFGPALYCAARHPKLPVHFIAPATICARMATLLKLQLNASRILVPGTISTAQLIEISSNTDVELEVLGFGYSSIPRRTEGSLAPCFGGWHQSIDASNDACYSARRHLSEALRQLPMLASLGIRALQIEPRNDRPDEVGNVARVWRMAIDRCLEDGARFVVDPSWHKQLSNRPVRH